MASESGPKNLKKWKVESAVVITGHKQFVQKKGKTLMSPIKTSEKNRSFAELLPPLNYEIGKIRLMKKKHDGRLAPAYFSPENKYFDQHLQTVKNETTL